MNPRRLLIGPLVLLAVWAVAVWWPTSAMEGSADERRRSLEADQLALVNTLGELNDATVRLQEFEADLARVAVAIPAEIDMPSLVRNLDAAADDADLRIEVFSPVEVLTGAGPGGRRPIPNGMSAVSLTLTGQGTYDAVMAFVREVGELPELVVIDTMALRSVDGESDDIVLDLELRVFTSGTGTISSVAGFGDDPPASELGATTRDESSRDPDDESILEGTR